MARRVLFFSYYFDPDDAGANVVGSVRAQILARYLPAAGWDPIVVTAGDPTDPAGTAGVDNTRVVRVSDRSAAAALKRRAGVDVGSLLATDQAARSAAAGSQRLRSIPRTLGAELTAFVPDSLSWSIRAARAGLELVRTERPDVIYSTSPSPAAHLAAWLVAVRSGVPWVAELRDLWSQHPERRGTSARRTLDRFVEHQLFRRARALVTVSPSLAEQLRTANRRTPVWSVLTGYDPTLVAPADQRLAEQFVVVYAGRIGARQSLVPFVRAIRRAADLGAVPLDDVRVQLLTMGTLGSDDRELIRSSGLAGVIEEAGEVPRRDAIRLERAAQILLHVRWDDPEQPGVLTGKLFEYLAARRPILSIGRYRDEAAALLEETGAGVATTSDDEIVRWLTDAYREFKATGSVGYRGDPDRLAAFDGTGTAAAVARILEESSRRRPGAQRHERA